MPQVSQKQEELKEEDSIYHKRIEDLLEDAEIEAEIETEKKVRSKNTRLLTISLVAIALIAFLYLQVKTGFLATSPKSNETSPLPELAQAPAVEQAPVSPEQIPSIAQAPITENETKPATAGDENAATPKTEEIIAEAKIPAPVVPVEKLEAPVVVQAPPKAPASEPAKIPEVAEVIKQPVKPSPAAVAPVTSAKQYHVQLGVFSVEENANRLLNNIKAKGFKPSILTKSTEASMYVVFLGGFSNKEDGNQAISELKSKGYSPVMEKFKDNSNTIVLGKFKNVGQAAALRDKLSIHGFLSSAKKTQGQTKIHIIQLGPFTSLPQAQKSKDSIERAGFKNTFIR
jgi:cell division protein FtsN